MVLIAAKQTEYDGLSFKSLTVGWVIVALLALFVYMLMRSPWGRVIKGIREDGERTPCARSARTCTPTRCRH